MVFCSATPGRQLIRDKSLFERSCLAAYQLRSKPSLASSTGNSYLLLYGFSVTNKTSYQKASPSRDSLAKGAKKMVLQTEEFERFDRCEVNEHEPSMQMI